jgi:CMP-N-acetylneuraminic acid synthetase
VEQNYVVVPARAGSKGIVNKNLIKVGGRSLTVRSLVHARKIVLDKNIIISTDSEKIISEVAEFFGIKSYELKLNSISKLGPFKIHYRNSALSSDSTLISEVLSAIKDLLEAMGGLINVICLLQPTTPFRSLSELSRIKSIISDNVNLDFSLVSVCTVDDFHPARMYYMNSNKDLEQLGGFAKYQYFRRQDLPEIYIRDGGFYIIGGSLIADGIQYTDKPKSFIRELPWSINIDSKIDLILAQNTSETEIKEDPNEL